MLIKAGGAARRSRQRLRSEEVDHQAALLGVVVFMRMMRGMRGGDGDQGFKRMGQTVRSRMMMRTNKI